MNDLYGKGDVYFIEVLDLKFDEVYKKNWLWFLYNLDRFVFVFYDVFD